MSQFCKYPRRDASRRLRFRLLALLAFAVVPVGTSAQWNPLNPVHSIHKDAKGLTLRLEKGALRFEVCSDRMVRVRFAPENEFPKVTEYVVIKSEWPRGDPCRRTPVVAATRSGESVVVE